MLYLSGVGPRQPGTNAIPGGPIHDEAGQPLDYDIKAQTQAVITNVERVLKEAGGSLEDVVDVTSFLVDMDRDFAGYNEVWARPSARSAPPNHPRHPCAPYAHCGRDEGRRPSASMTGFRRTSSVKGQEFKDNLRWHGHVGLVLT